MFSKLFKSKHLETQPHIVIIFLNLSLKPKMEVFTSKMSVSSIKTGTCYMVVLYFHKRVYSPAPNSPFPLLAYCVCEFAYLLKCICNPNSILGVFCGHLWTCHVHRTVKNLCDLMFIFPAGVKQGHSLPPCFSFHIANMPLLRYN